MNKLRVVPALVLMAALGACDDSLLDILPQDEIAEEVAIIDAETAEAALMGAYSGLQDTDLYGGDYVMWIDLLTDDVEHTGTFGSYGEADPLTVSADNGSVTSIWNDSYVGINRANTVIANVPEVEGLDADFVDEIVGQALGIRALHYFNLMRAFGAIPLVLEPPQNLDDIDMLAEATRPAGSAVWSQIEADIDAARTRLESAGVDNSGSRTQITPGFLNGLEAQVHLQQEDWAAAEAAAREVVNSTDYELVDDYGALFTATGAQTVEDLFRVAFTATDANLYGYYYQFEGRFEIGATQELYDLYDQADDERFAVSFDEVRSDGIEVVKYPTTAGTENIPVMRYAEVLLILAEALAEQGSAAQLEEAVDWLNEVRTRAGLGAYTWGGDLTTQAEVLDAIYLERRLELAFEGERWFDLHRTGRAAAALGSNFSPYEALLPIPESQREVAPGIDQNPDY